MAIPTAPLLPVREAWLALQSEAVLEPELPIVDPHHHLWVRPGGNYALDELVADTGAGHNITHTVFIQCRSMYRADGPEAMRPVGETEFINGIAAMSASGQYGPTRLCAGIVGEADFTLGEGVAAVLEAHIRAGGGRFRGIRVITAYPPDDSVGMLYKPAKGLMADSRFREGFAQLGPLGLTFDAWLFHTQLGEFYDLARAFPDTGLILDHIGTPLGIGSYAGKRQDFFPVWQRDIRRIAELPNVTVKLGGQAMQFAGWGYGAEPAPPSSERMAADWKPWFETCIEAFGVDRCMFESNFPVDKTGCSYVAVWNAFKRLATGASASEKDALFRATATRIYRLS